ncbi:MAG: ATP-binding protein [Pseudodesulfovibrio sp.]
MFDDTIQVYTAANVEIPYDLRFMPSVLDWAVSIADLSGGDQKEMDGLRLALEETLAFLIGGYPDAEQWELLRVDFKLMTDGMVVCVITNAGPPIHMDKIPEYNPDSPSHSDVDGLWYFLAKGAVDDLLFESLGMNGWRVTISQNLSTPSFQQTTKDASSQLHKKLKFITRPATLDDAGALMDLTYDTYGYRYSAEVFYHEARLRKALEEGAVISNVVENEGVVVGNSTMTLSKDTPRCGYYGSLMVKRSYRKTRAIMHLIKEGIPFMIDNPLGLDLFFATMVTANTASQKVGKKSGFYPLGLHLSVAATVDYRGTYVTGGPRESLLLCALLAKKPELEKIFLPGRHHAVMRPLLTQAGCDAELVADGDPSFSGSTEMRSTECSRRKTADITITKVGKDWATALRKKVFRLYSQNMRAIVVLFPVHQAIPQNLDEEMNRLNGVFTGLQPVSATEYYALYCITTNVADFDAIELADPLALDLKEHVRGHYTEIIGE